jgi:uncharacterized membrane protein YbhN (UPF0104 family)
MTPRFKAVLFFLAKLLFTFGILWLVVRNLDFADLRARLADSNPLMLVLALLLTMIQTLILALRWVMVMDAVGAPIPVWAGLRILLVSLWFNQVLPSSFGADAVRIWLLRRRRVAWRPAFHGVLGDRITALLGLVIMIVVMFPFLVARVDNLAAIATIGSLAVLGLAGTTVLATLDKWPARFIALWPISAFARLGGMIQFLLLRYRHRAALLGVAIVIHLLTVTNSLVIANMVHAKLSIIDALIFIPPIILLSSMPISISGWGVREGAMVAGLSLVGVAPSAALAISVLLGLTTMVVGLCGGALWLMSSDRQAFTARETATFAMEAEAAAPSFADFEQSPGERPSGSSVGP